jgi:hypothetical protein
LLSELILVDSSAWVEFLMEVLAVLGMTATSECCEGLCSGAR